MPKNILLKRYEGNKYVELHPLTKTSNVFNSKGNNVDQLVDELNTKIDSMQLIIDNFINPFTIGLSSDITIVEKGSTINSINFSWIYNRNPYSHSFEGVSLDVNDRNYLYATPLSIDKTFILSAIPYNGSGAKISTVSVKFLNGIYYGVSASKDYNNNLILSLTRTLSNNKSMNISVNPNINEYIYYCLPTRLGNVSFNVGGFIGGFAKVATIPFTNVSGYTENYDIYRSDNDNLGYTNVEII